MEFGGRQRRAAYNYTNGDAEVGLALCAKMRVRGQNLVWATGAQTPAYATGDGTNSAANQALVTANIQEHIQSEVQHFGSKVYAWDVVNEPLDPTQPDCLVHGPFYQVLGKRYLDVALEAAKTIRAAGTKLFINEYSTDDPERLACLVKVVDDSGSRGVPVDAIGHEMHNAINYPSTESMVNAINTVARERSRIEQQVTELDMSVYNAGDYIELRQQHSGLGTGRTGMALQEVTSTLFRGLERKDQRRHVLGDGG